MVLYQSLFLPWQSKECFGIDQNDQENIGARTLLATGGSGVMSRREK